MASLLKPVMFLMLANLCMGIPMFEESSRPKRSLLDTYNQSEIACIEQLKMLYTDGKCYYLLQRPPCPDHHWLVMNKELVVLPNGMSRSYPVCKPQPCRSFKVFWPDDNMCHSAARDKHRLCPYKGNKIDINPWGDGECICEPTHARHEVDVLNGKGTYAEFEGDCYPLYHQGPCLANQIFNTTLNTGGQVVGRCIQNPCQVLSNQNPGSAFAQLTPGGICHKLGQTGSPCSSDEKLDIHPRTKEPTCVPLHGGASMLSLFNTGDRCGGNIDKATNNCRKPLDIVENHFLRNLNKPRIRRVRPRLK